MNRLKREIKKMGSICLAAAMIISIVSTNVFALNSQYKEPLVFEDFEGDNLNVAASNNASVSYKAGFATGMGEKTAELKVTKSGDPGIDQQSLVITQDIPVDVSNYKYLTFWIKDNGTNSAKVHLIDASGSSTSGSWTGNCVAGKWSQLSVKLDQFTGIDLSRLTGITIGEWNAGTYYIDDVQFSDVLAKDLKVTASQSSGTYNDGFDVELRAEAAQTIYYTLDGSQPTSASTQYTDSINVSDSMVIKAIVVDNKNISEVYEFNYVIDHEDTSVYTPVVVQTFEEGNKFSAAANASASLTTDEHHGGNSSLKYVKDKSAGASVSDGSVKIDFNHAVNVENLKYLVFYIKDTQGSNTLQVSLIDSDGKESDFGWRSPSTSKNQWTQYQIKVSDFNKVDKTKITGMRIGQWNSGTYYIDDVYFDNYLYTGVPALTPSLPVASVMSGYIFKDNLSVSLKNDQNAPIYYTVDGTTPSKDSNEYTGAIKINQTTTVKAVSYDNGKYSEVIELKYIKDAAVLSDVVASKQPGKYVKAMKVALNNVDGLDIYYTLDGKNPTKSSLKYTGEIAVEQTTTIKAVAYLDNKAGNVCTFTYVYPTVPARVKANIEETVFPSARTIELISDVDANIYYTTDGSVPTINSTRYMEPLLISQTMEVKAIAERSGKISEVTTLSYVIAPGVAPVADKPAGTYDGSVVVEFRIPNNDKIEVYYTTDGTVPTIESNHYTQPLKVTETTTFTVGATYKGNTSIGKIATYEFVINPVTELRAPLISPETGIYGKKQQVSMSTETVDSEIYYTLDGTIPTKDSKLFKDAFEVSETTTIKAVTIKDNKVSDVTTNKIEITHKDSKFLKTDGKVIRNNYGAGEIVQLKGTNAGGWLVMEEWQCPTTAPDQKTMLETFTERFGAEKAWELINIYQDNWFTAEDFKVLKEEGVNVIRLPITYFEMAELDGSLKETAFDRLDWFIEEAAKQGIYTLIDMHGAFGSQNGKDHSGDITYPDKGDFFGNEENIQKTIKLWQAIAARYNGNEWVAGYDLLNEPGGALGTEQFEVYDRLYDAIRAIDQDHIIQIQAIWEPTHLPNPDLYGWQNVVYQYHFYGWEDINNLAYQKAFIDSKVKYVEETNYNVPLFVGEFTFFTNTDSWDYGLSVFDEQGWSYTSWTYKVAGANSSWGMYTMPKTDSTNVNISEDSFETIKTKWSNFDFTRNNNVSDVLSKHFKTVIVDETAPVINGHDASIKVGMDLPVEKIISLFIEDNQDGIISNDKAKITTDFDCNKVGEYSVKVEVSDKAGNTSKANFTITVRETDIDDDIAPVISGQDATVIQGETKSIEEIINLVITDNQDGNIANDQAVITTDYDCNKVGTYTVTVVVSDQAGNTSKATFKITVKEKNIPGDESNKPTVTPKPNEQKGQTVALKTGDSANLLGDMAVLGLSILISGVLIKKRKEI